VALVDQWRRIERELPEDWGVARLRVAFADEREAARAASLLGPINPGRRGNAVRIEAARRASGPSPDAVARLLARVDRERIGGELELVGAERPEPTQPAATPRASLADSWDDAVAGFPPDWSDVYAELEIVSTDWLDRTALLLAPANPARAGAGPAFRFRIARRFGYGVSAEMFHRCLERVDEARIRGALRILRVLSDTEPVATQGPVWYVEGRSV